MSESTIGLPDVVIYHVSILLLLRLVNILPGFSGSHVAQGWNNCGFTSVRKKRKRVTSLTLISSIDLEVSD